MRGLGVAHPQPDSIRAEPFGRGCGGEAPRKKQAPHPYPSPIKLERGRAHIKTISITT
jgi:hypothetical protein